MPCNSDHLTWGGKEVAKAIRRINKGKKPNEPVFDPELLPPESIIAVDLSTWLTPFAKSNEGAAQLTSVPLQSCTSVYDKLDVIYAKKIRPHRWRLILVVDSTFKFKDQVVRRGRNRTKENAQTHVSKIRKANFSQTLIKRLRSNEKKMASVTCDVVANAVEWANKRPGITAVCVNVYVHVYM